jgi:hypothetical protein
MKKLDCCVLLPLLLAGAGIGLASYLLFGYYTVEIQVESGLVGNQATVFGTVADSVSVPLVITAYLIHDGKDGVWVAVSGPLPQMGKHVLVQGEILSGLKIPGKLGGGTLLKHLKESKRWDFPI